MSLACRSRHVPSSVRFHHSCGRQCDSRRRQFQCSKKQPGWRTANVAGQPGATGGEKSWNHRHWRGFPEGSRLWRRVGRGANFFLEKSTGISEIPPKNGKKIRPENLCGHRCRRSRGASRFVSARQRSMPMKTFLLPCPCSVDIPVSAGLAGGRVDCPSCGRSVDVPKLRDLSLLREQPSAAATQTRWSPAHAVLLAGTAVAVICWAAAMLVLPRSDVAFDLEAIRAAVRAAPDQDIYKAWKQGLSRSGVARPPTPEEQKLLRTSRFSDGVSRGLQILGGLGALTAAAAAVRAFAKPAAGGGR